jgi:hypothetical protein
MLRIGLILIDLQEIKFDLDVFYWPASEAFGGTLQNLQIVALSVYFEQVNLDDIILFQNDDIILFQKPINRLDFNTLFSFDFKVSPATYGSVAYLDNVFNPIAYHQWYSGRPYKLKDWEYMDGIRVSDIRKGCTDFQDDYSSGSLDLRPVQKTCEDVKGKGSHEFITWEAGMFPWIG